LTDEGLTPFTLALPQWKLEKEKWYIHGHFKKKNQKSRKKQRTLV